MTNTQRGEAAVEIEGEAHVLRFTLGALAEIEDALKVSDPAALGARFTTMGAQDLQRVLCALLRAGGAPEPGVLAAAADPRRAAQAVAACLKANLS